MLNTCADKIFTKLIILYGVASEYFLLESFLHFISDCVINNHNFLPYYIFNDYLNTLNNLSPFETLSFKSRGRLSVSVYLLSL